MKIDGATIGDEIFKLMINIFAWQNERVKKEPENRLRQFKAHRKKMFILFCIDLKESCTLSELEKILAENRSTASVAVSKLYYDGLVSKNQPEKEDDGRKVYFKLTKKGKEVLNKFTDEFKKDITNFYNELSEEKKSHLVNGIVSLNKLFIDLN